MLSSIELQRHRIEDPTAYPFSVPTIQTLDTLNLSPSRLTFFTGENGSGKSTLLEAIALNYGLSLEGGNRNFNFSAELPEDDTYPLSRALKLGFRPARTGEGFFFRAETLFNFATRVDELQADRGYSDRSLHAQSHGEASMAALEYKFRRSGLFLLDEPEAALSPQRQLSFLILLHDTVREYPDAQFIVSTHSPILLGTPGAQILSFDGGQIHSIDYGDTPAFQITRRFLNDHEAFTRDPLRTNPRYSTGRAAHPRADFSIISLRRTQPRHRSKGESRRRAIRDRTDVQEIDMNGLTKISAVAAALTLSATIALAQTSSTTTTTTEQGKHAATQSTSTTSTTAPDPYTGQGTQTASASTTTVQPRKHHKHTKATTTTSSTTVAGPQ